MEEKNTFSYTYSAPENQEVLSIRQKYLPREESKFERLKKLDRKVQGAGVIESLCVGTVGALVFGVGMCFGLDALAGADWLAAVFCVLGCIIMAPAYPICKRIEKKAEAEFAPEILRLSEEIMKSNI